MILGNTQGGLTEREEAEIPKHSKSVASYSPISIDIKYSYIPTRALTCPQPPHAFHILKQQTENTSSTLLLYPSSRNSLPRLHPPKSILPTRPQRPRKIPSRHLIILRHDAIRLRLNDRPRSIPFDRQLQLLLPRHLRPLLLTKEHVGPAH